MLAAMAGVAHAQPTEPAGHVSAHFKDGLIFVDATLFGTPGLFLLDTGAGATAVDPHYAMAAQLHISRVHEQVTGRGGVLDVRRADPAALSIVGGPQARVTPVVTDLGAAARAMGVPLVGILGEDFVRQFAVTLDYRNRSVSFARDAIPPADATPIRVGNAPFVEAVARLGGRAAQGEFEIDTGSNTAIEFWRPFADAQLGRNLGARDVNLGLGIAGSAYIAKGRIDTLEVAGRRIASPEVNFADDTRDEDAGPRYGGVIGGPAWAGLVLTLDQPHQRLWVR